MGARRTCDRLREMGATDAELRALDTRRAPGDADPGDLAALLALAPTLAIIDAAAGAYAALGLDDNSRRERRDLRQPDHRPAHGRGRLLDHDRPRRQERRQPRAVRDRFRAQGRRRRRPPLVRGDPAPSPRRNRTRASHRRQGQGRLPAAADRLRRRTRLRPGDPRDDLDVRSCRRARRFGHRLPAHGADGTNLAGARGARRTDQPHPARRPRHRQERVQVHRDRRARRRGVRDPRSPPRLARQDLHRRGNGSRFPSGSFGSREPTEEPVPSVPLPTGRNRSPRTGEGGNPSGSVPDAELERLEARAEEFDL